MKGSGWPGRCAARVFFERHISPRRNQVPLLPLLTVRDERQAASAALVGVCGLTTSSPGSCFPVS
jgi:hypothetical protein